MIKKEVFEVWQKVVEKTCKKQKRHPLFVFRVPHFLDDSIDFIQRHILYSCVFCLLSKLHDSIPAIYGNIFIGF